MNASGTLHSRSRSLPQFIAILLLLVALNPSNPYAYYMLLRLVVFAVFIYIAYLAFERGRIGWTWIALFLALLYNPYHTVHLNRAIWSVVNIATVGVILVSMSTLTPPGIAKEDAHHE